MPTFRIEGGQPLHGEVVPSGNKNAALPILAACLLTDEPVTLHNIPDIGDVRTMRALLESLGVSVEAIADHTLRVRASEVREAALDPDLCRRIRASILLAGPLLGRIGVAELPPPGGDYIGRRGLERRFEAELRGVDGKQRVVVDALGNALRGSDLIPEAQRHEPSQPGLNLVLSLDWRLQEFAERTFPATAGTVLAMDPKTGFLLALVDRPASDPNKLSGRITRTELAALRDDPLKPMLLRPTQNHYHPGSTYKLVTALAALTSEAITPRSGVTCTGTYHFGGRTWRCWREAGHGRVELKEAITRSCDSFFYYLGETAGIDAIADAARELGFGVPTGLGLDVFEVPGVNPTVEYHNRVTPEGYQKGFALNTAIGQGDVNVTPMQLAMAYATVANGGTLYKPQVVKRVETVDGRPIRVFGSEVVRKTRFKPEAMRTVVEGLIGVVNDPYGTAYGKRLKDVVVAGKTGTAQVVVLGEKRLKLDETAYEERDHAWFVSFAPAEAPEILVLVLNEHAGHGSSAAAPAALEVIKTWLQIRAEEQAAQEGPPPAPEPPPKPRDEPMPRPGPGPERHT